MWRAFWDVDATIADELNGFKNVVTRVVWKLTVHRSGRTATQRGVVDLPAPTSAETFIDLDVLQGKTRDEKREIVLQWAELVKPGFVDDRINELLAQITDRPKPQQKTIKIL